MPRNINYSIPIANDSKGKQEDVPKLVSVPESLLAQMLEQAQMEVLVRGRYAVTAYQCVGDRIVHATCSDCVLSNSLHIGVGGRKKRLLRHTDTYSPALVVIFLHDVFGPHDGNQDRRK
jgi:hypothetical protein